jgi:hypothetical protein
MRTIYPSVFKKPEVVNKLRRLHDNFVLVPADKASNNIVFVCKNYYYECLLNELGLTSTSGNPMYTRTTFTRDGILQNHLSVLNTFDIPKNQDQFDLPSTFIGFQNYINIPTKKDTLLVPVNALQSHYFYYSLN